MGLPRSLVLGQAAAAALLSDVDGASSTGRLLLQQSANATFANMPSMSILGTQIVISSAAATGTIANDAMYGAIVAQDSYHIHDLGGLYVQPDPYSQAVSGIKRVTAYQRSAGMVVRPESIVPLTA
jgi:HK97 family phage major capsid protein